MLARGEGLQTYHHELFNNLKNACTDRSCKCRPTTNRRNVFDKAMQPGDSEVFLPTIIPCGLQFCKVGLNGHAAFTSLRYTHCSEHRSSSMVGSTFIASVTVEVLVTHTSAP
jgi:hypothetical protein